ncbi:hypothetical protein M407DRAFT_116339 [Tulasnella calospora MUT 4182]|uniref:Uncharacterized protein n=1 Tax=Tulasnella calospora MUT 4182 TaxID=1051891 RepID=A0A0C3QBT3_9AGAM|nr:hypothetical protein M407DRAFT_116339 [Tulasnella calospora MUT 4182]
MSLKGGGMRFDSDSHQQSSTTASEIETTTSSTEIQPVLTMSMKGGGSRFDSASHQESTSTSTEVESTVTLQQSKGGSRRLGRTSPLPALTVGPPSMFMTGMESPFTPSTSSMVESGVIVDVHGRSGSAVSATRQSFSSSSEIKTSSSEIRTSSSAVGVSSTSTATLGVDAAGSATTSTVQVMRSPRSPHTAVVFHSPRSPHTAVAFHSSDGKSEEHQETVVESKQSTSTVKSESGSFSSIQVSDYRAGSELVIEDIRASEYRAGSELVIEPRIGVQLIDKEADK